MLTLAEAAVLLGVHPDVLRRQIHRGKLKGRKVGRDWHVTANEVERYRRENLRSYLATVSERVIRQIEADHHVVERTTLGDRCSCGDYKGEYFQRHLQSIYRTSPEYQRIRAQFV